MSKKRKFTQKEENLFRAIGGAMFKEYFIFRNEIEDYINTGAIPIEKYYLMNRELYILYKWHKIMDDILLTINNKKIVKYLDMIEEENKEYDK